jgi:hypothetical protein
VALQRLDVGRRAIVLEVGSARVNAERIIGEPAGDEAAGLWLIEADHHVNLAARERRQLRQRHQLQAHGGMTLREVAQRAHEIIGREPVGRADANIARQFEIDAGDLALRMQERAFHLLGGADEALAGASKLSPGRASVEQLGADRGLQRRDATADRRVVKLEPLGGGDELPATRDSEENADVIPVHGTWRSA